MHCKPILLVALLVGAVPAAAGVVMGPCVIFSPPDASPLEALAAREVRRYVYLRTGRLLPIRAAREPAEGADGIAVARKERPLVAALATRGKPTGGLQKLAPQAYLLRTIPSGGGRVLLIAGGDDAGVLYGAYRFAEHLGVRFFLHGDTIPDGRIPLALPDLDERAAPLFPLRGIQPFHDFPEGPDWWDREDYKAIIAQLPKLRMNFIGLHTYPEKRPNAEPTVWIGLPEDVGPDGRVRSSYPASYQNTLRGNWGYAAKKTGTFAFGASQLFEDDAYGCEVMRGLCPQPDRPEDCDEVFRRTAAMLGDAFRFAHRLGVKTCVGTETPLTVPARVAARIKAGGRDPASMEVRRSLYEGIFLRAARACPLDYYWFWTPEGWTWRGASDAQLKGTIDDILAAVAAAARVKAPFRLATCGWVLGPQSDRALFDRVLPEGMPVSCINRQVGKEPVDPAFARVERRPKWAIPWLEDDPALTSPQLWVGRMRRDGADALRYGCSGLMGIHWRTRVLGPNVSALARAAWTQEPWGGAAAALTGAVGGKVATFPDHEIAGTDDDPLYRTVRYDMSAYRFSVPAGTYAVTLRFCEPHYGEAGKRVFGVRIEGREVLEGLDIFARVGKDRALDLAYRDIRVEDGVLDIDFVREVEFPCIAAIAVEGEGLRREVNCGGPAYGDYAADAPASSRFAPVDDFYRDWARQQFGPEAAGAIAAIFARIDGRLPRPSDWVGGPGGLRPDGRSWEDAREAYVFVGELEALAPRVRGPANRARFAYWLATFRYMRALAHARTIWAAYNGAMKAVKGEKDPAARKALARAKALPLRVELVRTAGEVSRHLLRTVSTTGELGTVANWEQHILPSLLEKPGEELARILGGPLPPEARLPKIYDGPARIIVPTSRTSLEAGEALVLKVIVLSARPAREAALFWRPLGPGPFARLPLRHVARGVHAVTIPAERIGGRDLEYYVRVVPDRGMPILFPETAPERNRTVVVVPGAR